MGVRRSINRFTPGFVALISVRLQSMSNTPSNKSNKPAAQRYFYSVATVLLLVLAVVGFQLFYFHGKAYPDRPLTPPIKTLIITHGTAMTLWLLLAIIQPLLVASGNRHAHMGLGKVMTVIAVCLVLLGLKMAIAACKVAPPDLMFGPLTPKQFMSVPVGDIALFGMFVAAGVLMRKRPDIHKPMMFLASLAAVDAALARIDILNNLYHGTMWQKLFSDFFFALVIAGVFLIAKCVVFRKFDRWFAAGFAVMVVWFFMVAQIATTHVWDAIASFLLR